MRCTSLVSTVDKYARWASVTAAAWLYSHCAAGELETLFGCAGEGKDVLMSSLIALP